MYAGDYMENTFKHGVLAGYEKPKKLSQKEINQQKAQATKAASAIHIAKKKAREEQSRQRKIDLAKRDPFGNGNLEVRRYENAKASSESCSNDLPKRKSLKTWQGGGCSPR